LDFYELYNKALNSNSIEEVKEIYTLIQNKCNSGEWFRLYIADEICDIEIKMLIMELEENKNYESTKR
jgi:hypothetical protein